MFRRQALIAVTVALGTGLASCADSVEGPSLVGQVSAGLACSGNEQCSSGVCTDGVCASFATAIPRADPGREVVIVVGATATLDGSASSDPLDRPLTFSWTLRDRPANSGFELGDETSELLTVTPDVAGIFVFELVVHNGVQESQQARALVLVLNTDGTLPLQPEGAPCTSDEQCASQSCEVGACASNTAPSAVAGGWQQVEVGALVQLDASGSADADGDLLSYTWELSQAPTGSTSLLSDNASPSPTFTADAEGLYVARLWVNDGKVTSAPAAVGVYADKADTRLDDGEACTADDECASDFCFEGTCKTNDKPTADAGKSQLIGLGATAALDGTGSFDPEGLPLTHLWAINEAPVGSIAALDSSTSDAPSFTPDLVGVYTVRLVVNDGMLDSQASAVAVVATDAQAGDLAPIADAGDSQTVDIGTIVTLSGADSYDPEGQPLTYAWAIVDAPPTSTASLNDSALSGPVFIPDLPGLYILQLTVDDGTTASLPAQVAFMAVDPTLLEDGQPCVDQAECASNFCPDGFCATNAAPIADAGEAQAVITGAEVTLDGSDSSDPESQTLTYAWTLASMPSGSAAALDDPALVAPKFTADLDGLYTAELIVNDGELDSAVSSVTVAVGLLPNGQPCVDPSECQSGFCHLDLCETNDPPIAHAGPFQQAATGQETTLTGSASYDPEGAQLTYAWTFSSTPPGSAATLSGAATVGPSFTPDLEGIYEIELTVSDGALESVPSVVTIAVGLADDGAPCSDDGDCASGYCDIVCTPNLPPEADAGPLQKVLTQTQVTLDGSQSSDEESADLTYLWTLASVPTASAAVLSDAAAVNPTFTADVEGVYTAQLVVDDGRQPSAPAFVAVIASEPTPEPDGTPCVQDAECLSGYCHALVCTTNALPIAHAGDDGAVMVGETATLNGSASNDPEGGSLAYLWTIDQAPSGSTATIDNPTWETASFVPDVDGIYVVRLVVNDGYDSSVADFALLFVDPVPDPGPLDYCEDIAVDTTWSATTIYRITCNINVHQGATLTIEPGTEVRFNANTSLRVYDGGALMADATATDTIRLIPHLAGSHWDGVRIMAGSNGAGTVIRNVDIVEAGDSAGGTTSRQAAVAIEDTDGFVLEDVLIDDSKAVGVGLLGTSTPATWANVTITAGTYPIEVQANRAHLIGTGNYASVDANTDAIHVYASGGTIESTGTWASYGLPWRVAPDLTFQGAPGSPAILTLADGVTLQLNSGVRLLFYSDSAMVAVGSDIRMEATNPATPWDNLEFDGAAGDQIELSGVTITGTGSYTLRNGVVVFRDMVDGVIFENNVVHGNGVDGVSFEDAGPLVDGSGSRFSGNAIYDNVGYPVRMDTHSVERLGTNSYTSPSGLLPNTIQAIHIWSGDDADRTISADSTWIDPGIPYRPGSFIRVLGPSAGPTATLTLSPGVAIEFSGDTLQIQSQGALHALGTVLDPIRLSGLEGGSWYGVRMVNCDGAKVALEHVHISDGGNFPGLGSVAAALLFDACGAGVNVDRVTVSGGATRGIVFSGSQIAPGSFRGNVVENVAGNFLRFNINDMINLPDAAYDPAVSGVFTTGNDPAVKKVEVHSDDHLVNDITLPDLGVPYHFSHSVWVESLGFTPTILTVRPNVLMAFNGGNQFNGLFVGNLGGLDMQGNAAEPITLDAWGTGNNFTGVRVNQDADYPNITMTHIRIRSAGFYDYFPGFPGGVNVSAAIALKGAWSGTFDSISTVPPLGGAGSWGVYFKDPLVCPTMTNMAILAPDGAGSECGDNVSASPDCCAAAGLP